MRSVGAELAKQWREREGLSQADAAVKLSEIAEAAGFDVKLDAWYLSKLERGARKPGRALAALFVRAAGIPTEDWDRTPRARRAS